MGSALLGLDAAHLLHGLEKALRRLFRPPVPLLFARGMIQPVPKEIRKLHKLGSHLVQRPGFQRHVAGPVQLRGTLLHQRPRRLPAHQRAFQKPLHPKGRVAPLAKHSFHRAADDPVTAGKIPQRPCAQGRKELCLARLVQPLAQVLADLGGVGRFAARPGRCGPEGGAELMRLGAALRGVVDRRRQFIDQGIFGFLAFHGAQPAPSAGLREKKRRAGRREQRQPGAKPLRQPRASRELPDGVGMREDDVL